MYAVIRDGSMQLKVAVGDMVEIERTGLEPGSNREFDVLVINKDGQTTFGTPTVAGARVVGEVVNEVKCRKIHVMRFTRRKHTCKRRGHRQRRTLIRITEIAD